MSSAYLWKRPNPCLLWTFANIGAHPREGSDWARFGSRRVATSCRRNQGAIAMNLQVSALLEKGSQGRFRSPQAGRPGVGSAMFALADDGRARLAQPLDLEGVPGRPRCLSAGVLPVVGIWDVSMLSFTTTGILCKGPRGPVGAVHVERGEVGGPIAVLRSASLSIFPIAFKGSSDKTAMVTGRLYGVSRWAHQACRSASTDVGTSPVLTVTNAVTTSPHI